MPLRPRGWEPPVTETPANPSENSDWAKWVYPIGGALASGILAKSLLWNDDDEQKKSSFWSRVLKRIAIAGAGGLGAAGGHVLSKSGEATPRYWYPANRAGDNYGVEIPDLAVPIGMKGRPEHISDVMDSGYYSTEGINNARDFVGPLWKDVGIEGASALSELGAAYLASKGSRKIDDSMKGRDDYKTYAEGKRLARNPEELKAYVADIGRKHDSRRAVPRHARRGRCRHRHPAGRHVLRDDGGGGERHILDGGRSLRRARHRVRV